MSVQCHVETQAYKDLSIRVRKSAQTCCPSHQQRGIWRCQQIHTLLPLPYLAQTTPVQFTFAQLRLHVLFQKQVQRFTLVDHMVQCVCAGPDASSLNIDKGGSIDNLTLLMEG